MTDCDSKYTTVETYTTLALELDAAMERSDAARAAYKATWGVEWIPCFAVVASSVDMDCEFDTGLAVGTDAHTIAR